MKHFDPDLLKTYSQESGVYLMKDSQGVVLYVGKAKNLRTRLKQYFDVHDKREMIPFLIEKIASIDTILTLSEKEALLLENTLIKKHQPRYNALLKDDKMFVSLLVTTQHRFPMLKLIRHKGGGKKEGLYFGPYTNAYAAKETFDILTRVFPLRQCSDQELASRKRPCLLYSIKRCLAPCANKCTKQEYDFFVQQTVEFLKGHDKGIIESLKKKMTEASENLEFEKAGHLLKAIKQLEAVQGQSKSLVHSHHMDCDAFGVYRAGVDLLLVLLTFREGKLVGSDHFYFTECAEPTAEMLEHFMLDYYLGSKELPKEVLLPLPLENMALLSEVLLEKKEKSPKFSCPEKGEKKQLVQLASENAKDLFRQKVAEEEKQEQYLMQLQAACHLSRFPMIIECFDTSNMSGSNAVASMITFRNGKKDPKHYRSYKIKGAQSDDYSALKEVLTRRFSKKEEQLPDLIIMDGGKGQLSVADKILKDLGIASCDLIALTKENARHDKGLTQEKVYILDEKEPILFEKTSPVLFLLQQIRDEAHRRAITLQRKQREKKLITSALDQIPGIGPIKKGALLKKFGSVKKIFESSREELLTVSGISKKDCQNILNYRSKF